MPAAWLTGQQQLCATGQVTRGEDGDHASSWHRGPNLALVSDCILQDLLEGQAVHPCKGSGLHEVGGNPLCELPLTNLLKHVANLQSHDSRK